MPTLDKICDYLDCFAPAQLAESWDNTGLLIGDRNQEVKHLMTCLTVTPESVAEAIERGADLIVSHHPMMFRPVNKILASSTSGKMLLDLIRNDVAVYSPHTAFDSTTDGINEQICHALQLNHSRPLKPLSIEQPDIGSGRIGKLANPTTVEKMAETIKQKFKLESLAVVGESGQEIETIAMACGSGGSFLSDAIKLGANAFVTGETTFHTCLESKAEGIALFLLGHFASERFAVEALAVRLMSEFDNITVWASVKESDPVRLL